MLSVIGTTWFATSAFSSDDDEKKKDKFIGPAVPGVPNNKKKVKKRRRQIKNVYFTYLRLKNFKKSTF